MNEWLLRLVRCRLYGVELPAGLLESLKSSGIDIDAFADQLRGKPPAPLPPVAYWHVVTSGKVCGHRHTTEEKAILCLKKRGEGWRVEPVRE